MTTSNEHNNAPAVRLSQEQIRALAICLESCRVSISEVQRKLQISFNEANDLCQSLVDAGYATGLALAPSLRATQAPAPAREVSDKHEREMLEVINERDRINEWADQLADAIAKHTGYEIGEHTSENNPWRMALNALVCHEAKQEVGLTDDERQQVFRAAETRMVREINLSWRNAVVDEVIAALRAKGGK